MVANVEKIIFSSNEKNMNFPVIFGTKKLELSLETSITNKQGNLNNKFLTACKKKQNVVTCRDLLQKIHQCVSYLSI